MGDISQIQQQINMLRFQQQIENPASSKAQQLQRQIDQLMQQLAAEKIRQGVQS